MTKTLSTEAVTFINDTPKGSDFAFSNSRTGEHREDGTVTFDYDGLVRYEFSSIEDFAEYFIDFNRSIVHQQAFVVGFRDEDGNISFTDEVFPDDELDLNDDSDAVYTKLNTIRKD